MLLGIGMLLGNGLLLGKGLVPLALTVGERPGVLRERTVDACGGSRYGVRELAPAVTSCGPRKCRHSGPLV